MTEVKVTASTRTGGKKSKRKDNRPSRARYWMSRILEERKVRNLMRCCGMTRQAAYNHWHRVRGTKLVDVTTELAARAGWTNLKRIPANRNGRVPAGYIKKVYD